MRGHCREWQRIAERIFLGGEVERRQPSAAGASARPILIRLSAMTPKPTQRFIAYSSDGEQSFHAMVNGAWRGQLEIAFLRQVFTIRQAVPVHLRAFT